MRTILVTGATGFVGSHTIPALADAGHRVVALVRDADDADLLRRRLTDAQAACVEARVGDVTKPDTLPSALQGVDAVLHLVAIPRDFDGGQTLRLVNTEGTRFVVEAARSAGVRRFLHMGALGVADDPELHFARSKARGEAIVMESDLDWTILKPSILFGPRDGFFNILAGLIRMSPGIVPLAGSGTARFQPLSIDDFAKIVVAVLEDDATVGRTYELGGPRYWTYREIVQEVLRGLGKRRLLLPVPVPLISLVAGAAELVRLPFPVATDQLRQLRLDNVGPIDGVRDAFGFEPRPMAGALGYLRERDQEPTAA